jgi:nitrite reductase/ring-hydroxylating ferredoxin subunit
MDRRRLLQLLACSLPLGACAPPPAPARETRVALADLPLDQRTIVTHLGQPVELLRTREGLEARSLLCPHFGCTLSWTDETGRYRCPCHQGEFDATGRVLAGPSASPMTHIPFDIVGSWVVLHEPPGWAAPAAP